MARFPVHTALTILTFGALVGAPRLGKRPSPAPAAPAVAIPAPVVKPAAPVSKLLDDSAGQLDGFFQALRTKKVVRITHYGDSPTTADLITGDIRALLQEKHGDAGHGFVLIAKPWAWYGHTGVAVNGSGWQMSPASRFEQKDGLFGLGGVSFVGDSRARSKLTFDRKQSKIAVWYLRHPGGGSFTVSADGVEVGRVETDGELSAETASFDGGQRIELAVAQGAVRLFGVVAENGATGLVYDSIGLNGASITVLTRMIKESHWAAELRRRAPDLLILNYGANEADFPSFVDKGYETELREAIRRAKAALPGTSILLMSPMDRGQKVEGEIRTMATIPQIVEIQRRVARETGCGFFDTYTAMGGEGTMARWYAEKPRLVSADFLHPYPAGGRKIAEIFVREIEAGLRRSDQSGKVH